MYYKTKYTLNIWKGTYDLSGIISRLSSVCVCVCVCVRLAVSDTSLSSGEYDLFPSLTQ